MLTEAQEAEKKKESQEDSVETYEAAFQKIKEMTGEEDLDLLVRRFITVEDTNFALFNYVNEQNNEIEKLNDEIQAVSFCFTHTHPHTHPPTQFTPSRLERVGHVEEFDLKPRPVDLISKLKNEISFSLRPLTRFDLRVLRVRLKTKRPRGCSMRQASFDSWVFCIHPTSLTKLVF